MKPVTALAVIIVVVLVILGIVFWQLGMFENPVPETASAGEPITPTDLAAMTPTEFAVITPAGQADYSRISVSSGGLDQFAPSTTPVQSSSVSYTVKPGDTLWIIAQNFYNDGTKWKVIQDANNISDPSKIKVGITLTIPDASNSSFTRTVPVQMETSVAAPPVVGGKYHTVVRGDNLWKLARKYYNDSTKTTVIFEANRDKLSTPETTLKTGWKLLIPAIQKNEPAPKSGAKQPAPKPAAPPPAQVLDRDNVPSGMDD